MTRTLLWSFVAFAMVSCAPAEMRPRSVVLIVVDTLRADHLGAYGHVRPTSPNIDRLAVRAAVFERAWATSSWTLPSYGSILTGALPSGHGAGRRLAGGSLEAFTGIAPGVPTLPQLLSAAGFATAGIANNPFLRERFEIARGFDTWEYVFRDYDDHPRGDALVDWALRWLGAQIERRPDQPFLLMVNFFDPHLPYDPGKSARGAFTRTTRSERLSLPFAGLGPANPRWQPLAPERDFVEAAYDEEIRYVDEQLGRLLAALGEDVLVVVTADHGEELFEHGGFEHGHSMFDEVLRVPLLIAGPGVIPGRIDAPVSIADVTPTILDALGESVPDLAGRSLWPSLSSRAGGTQERLIVAESTLRGPQRRTLIRWPWKLLVTEGQPPRLYDLDSDPREQHDLGRGAADQVARLAAELDNRLAQARSSADTLPAVELDPETRHQLEGLGYLQDNAP